MQLGSRRYPVLPTLNEGETEVVVFEGLRVRMTLTEERVIFSRFGHRSIPYETIIDVSGGIAGPNFATLRDNETIRGGIYILSADHHEEWAHIPNGEEAAEQIRARSPDLWQGDGSVWDWVKLVQQRLQ